MNVNILNLSIAATRSAQANEFQQTPGESQVNRIHAQTDSVTLSPAASAAAQGKAIEADPVDRYQALASNQAVARTRQAMAPAKVSREDFMKAAIEGTLDQRLGLDREKLQEIEDKMKEVAENSSLTIEQKTEQLDALQAQIDDITREAGENTFRQEQTAKIEKEIEQLKGKF